MDLKDKKSDVLQGDDMMNFDLGTPSADLFPGIPTDELHSDTEEEIIPKKESKKVEEQEEDSEGKDKRSEKSKEKKNVPTEQEIEDAISNNKKKQKKESQNEPVDDSEDLYETEMVTSFIDVLSEKWGWDLEEEKKPKTIDEFVGFMEKVIDQNAKPEYADEIVERFDKYVKEGGDPRQFIKIHYEIPDYAKMDPKDESQAKAIITDYYASKGMPIEKIKKLISKLEVDNELESEALDYQKELDEMTNKQRENIVRVQEQKNRQNLEIQQKNIQQTINYINKSSEVAGIPLSDKVKRELVPYMFKRDAEGFTQMQREYQEDPLEYMLTNAFLWKHRNELKNLINDRATTTAAQKLREKSKELLSKSKRSADQSQDNDDTEDFVTTIHRRVNQP